MFRINQKSLKQTIKVLFGSISATLMTLSSVQSATVPTYSIVELGTLPGDDVSISTSINQLGQIVGYSVRNDSLRFRAFLWEKGTIKDLGTLGGNESTAWDINNSGRVVGGAQISGDDNSFPVSHGFLWTKNAGMMDITSSTDAGRGEAINDAGQIIISQDNQAFLLNNGIKTELCADSSKGCLGYDISNSGLIVGYAEVALRQTCEPYYNTTICYEVTARRAHLWRNGKMINLGTIGDATDEFNWSAAIAINSKGQIVGQANNQCVLWERNGKPVKLSNSGSNCTALDINNQGWVVGRVDTDVESRAVLWRNQQLQDLNNLIPRNSGWLLNEARSINNAGQITGYGTFNGKTRAFLLTPQ